MDADGRAQLVAGNALIDSIMARLQLHDLNHDRAFTWPLCDARLRFHVQLLAILQPPVPV